MPCSSMLVNSWHFGRKKNYKLQRQIWLSVMPQAKCLEAPAKEALQNAFAAVFAVTLSDMINAFRSSILGEPSDVRNKKLPTCSAETQCTLPLVEQTHFWGMCTSCCQVVQKVASCSA